VYLVTLSVQSNWVGFGKMRRAVHHAFVSAFIGPPPPSNSITLDAVGCERIVRSGRARPTVSGYSYQFARNRSRATSGYGQRESSQFQLGLGERSRPAPWLCTLGRQRDRIDLERGRKFERQRPRQAVPKRIAARLHLAVGRDGGAGYCLQIGSWGGPPGWGKRLRVFTPIGSDYKP
jgi:hypothetical protein